MPFKRVVILPWKMSSSGAKMVAAHLTTMGVECLRVYPDRSYKPTTGDLIVGWGCGSRPLWADHLSSVDCHYINSWSAICNSVDKITALGLFKRHKIPIPPFTLSGDTALSWSKDGHWVCCRQNVEGMDGAGLVLAMKPKEMVPARLYTQFIPNKKEFRLYCFAGRVLDILKKVPDSDAKDKYIRTEANNYLYIRNNIGCTAKAQETAKAATDALDLTFAGVDLIIGEDDEPYVLETNTAPGIGQITAHHIANAIRSYAGL